VPKHVGVLIIITNCILLSAFLVDVLKMLQCWGYGSVGL